MEEKKRCSKCGKEKLLSSDKAVSDFHLRPTGKPYSECKPCHREYTTAHYRANKAKYLAKARRHDDEYREKTYEWLFQYFREHPCVDCGETNPIVLEFDHRDGEKKDCDVSNLIKNSSLRKVQQEVAKCEVRCSNCHLKRTAIQCNWYWVEFLARVAQLD